MNDVLLGVIIGGIIGGSFSIVATWLSHHFTSKQQEERWKEEKQAEKEKSTIEFFRSNYHILAPFSAFCSKFNLIVGGSFFLGEKLTETQGSQISALLPEFIKAYRNIADEGYLELLPNDLRGQMFRYGNYLSALKRKHDEKPKLGDWDMKDHRLLFDFMRIQSDVRSGIRKLLDVEVLDFDI